MSSRLCWHSRGCGSPNHFLRNVIYSRNIIWSTSINEPTTIQSWKLCFLCGMFCSAQCHLYTTEYTLQGCGQHYGELDEPRANNNKGIAVSHQRQTGTIWLLFPTWQVNAREVIKRKAHGLFLYTKRDKGQGKANAKERQLVLSRCIFYVGPCGFDWATSVTTARHCCSRASC